MIRGECSHLVRVVAVLRRRRGGRRLQGVGRVPALFVALSHLAAQSPDLLIGGQDLLFELKEEKK